MIWFISKFSVEYGYIINEMGGELSVGLEHPDECASGVDNIWRNSLSISEIAI